MLDGFIFLPGEKTKMIDYFITRVDSFGYVHSIDNIVIFYLTNISVDAMLDVVRAKSKTFAVLDYWERLDIPPRRNFPTFIHEVHFGDLFIKIGRHKEESTDYGTKRLKVVDCVRFEINPNKHCQTKEWYFMLELIEKYCVDGVIDKLDYAIDIPLPKEKVIVLKSRKTYGFFNGTRYYGKRNKHGYVKIYDKFKERLDEANAIAKKMDVHFRTEDYYDCTRVEITLKNGQPFSGIDFGVTGDLSEPDGQLSDTLNMYLDMLQHILLLGGDIDGHFKKINYRSRLKLEPYLYGTVHNYVYDMELITGLIGEFCEVLRLRPFEFRERPVNSSTFVEIGPDDFLPFAEYDPDSPY